MQDEGPHDGVGGCLLCLITEGQEVELLALLVPRGDHLFGRACFRIHGMYDLCVESRLSDRTSRNFFIASSLNCDKPKEASDDDMEMETPPRRDLTAALGGSANPDAWWRAIVARRMNLSITPKFFDVIFRILRSL